MPLYEYECQQCRRHTEKRQKFSDPEITVCPYCGGHLQRVISAPNIAFKGGGWYKDLYSSPKPAASSEIKGETKSESKGDGSAPSEAKGAPSGSETTGSTASSSSTPAPANSTPAAAAPSPSKT